MAHSQQIEIARAAEVEIAVLQAQVFVDFVGAFVVEREGQRFADIVDYHIVGHNLNLARF